MDAETRDAGRRKELHRRMAARAWRIVARYVARKERDWPDIDVGGLVAERICSLVGSFDRAKSSFRTWAYRQAYYGFRDAQRGTALKGYERRHRMDAAPYVMSLDTPWSAGFGGEDRDRIDRRHGLATTTDEAPDWEQMEAARHLLRGLTPGEFAALWGSEIEGKTLKAIGRELGISESRMSQLRTDAIERLRYAGRTA